MTDELELVRRARPEVHPPSHAARVAAHQALDRAIGTSSTQRQRRFRVPLRVGAMVPALGVLVVIAVVVVFLGIRGTKPSGTASPGGVELVFRARPTSRVPLSEAAMARTLALVRLRLNAVTPGAHVSAVGDAVLVKTSGGARVSLGELVALVDAPGQLLFYDWEANVLTPNGHTVASQLQTQDPTAVEISQGSSASVAGSSGSGSMSLYRAVELAAKQPAWVRVSNSRAGSEYFMFGATGSSSCAAAARYYAVTELSGQRCYLAGPQDSIAALHASLPSGVSASASGVQTRALRQGWVVLQAATSSFSRPLAWSDPSAQYYVLRDHVSLFGNDITNPQQRTDTSGGPDLQFGFTSKGKNEFQSVTGTIARRGQLDSTLGQTLDQHFAVALDTQLITLPQIDFRQYPNGIPGDHGADITAGFTTRTARLLAAELRLGALPVHLTLVSINGH
jgi:hypothetical protein